MASFSCLTLDYNRERAYDPLPDDFRNKKAGGNAGLMRSKKLTALMMQLEDRQADIVVLQETCCPKDGTLATRGYL